jgi:deazaflavin-dependent oxidoreductase (nitroreductase family)
MKLLKWAGVIAAIYVVFVLLFEFVYLGFYQPSFEEAGIPMLVITTTDSSGQPRDRRLANFETDGKVYLSAHHWPRGWYHEAVANPEVRVEIDGVTADYVAIPVEGEEFDRVAAEHPLGFVVMFLMGFPPERDILRLDPAG